MSLVSVLFSEPKIPQCQQLPQRGCFQQRFSALQRAENSSSTCTECRKRASIGFSALQRAENSSTAEPRTMLRNTYVSVLFSEPKIPQCSLCSSPIQISYLFQCSSASRKFLNFIDDHQYALIGVVSVLFSEPKIPQSARAGCGRVQSRGFSALQRAENSSTARPPLPLRSRR